MGTKPRLSRTESVPTPARIAALCARQHGVVAARQLREIGVSHAATHNWSRHGVLVPILPRVYSLSPEITERGRRTAALLAVDGWAVLSHWSAAELYEIGPRPNRVHHVAALARSRQLGGWVHIHKVRQRVAVRRVGGFLVTEPERVLLDLATLVHGRALERVVSEAQFRRLVGDDAVAAAVARYPGHPGAATLRRAVRGPARQRRTESPLEDRVLALLDAGRLPLWVTQFWVSGISGHRYRADFAWPDRRVLLEADGRAAHRRAAAFDADRQRDADLAAVGWKTLRVSSHQLDRDPAIVLAALRTSLGLSG